jgi:hypothetical protein
MHQSALIASAAVAVSALAFTSSASAGFLWEHDCVNNGCLQLATHIATTSVPYSTGSTVYMGTTAVGNSRVISFCRSGVLTHARKADGNLITVTSGNGLRGDVSVCGTTAPNNLEVIGGNRSCGATSLRPIVMNGFDLAISTGSTPSGNDPVNDDYVTVKTGSNGATYLCGGNGRQHFDASNAAFPLLWGYSSNDFLTTSEFEGGWLFGGNDNDTLIGDTSATSLCYGEFGLDVCLGCTHHFECDIFR